MPGAGFVTHTIKQPAVANFHRCLCSCLRSLPFSEPPGQPTPDPSQEGNSATQRVLVGWARAEAKGRRYASAPATTGGSRSGFPFLDLFDEFLPGDVLDGGDEFDAVGFLQDLPAIRLGERVQLHGGERGEIPLLELALHEGKLFGELAGAVLTGPQEPVLEVIQLDGGLVLELEAELPAPLDERAARDPEFGGDAGQGPALGAALDEFLTDFRRVHDYRAERVFRIEVNVLFIPDALSRTR